MFTKLLLGLQLRITEAGHLAVFDQNLSGGKALLLQWIRGNGSIERCTIGGLYCSAFFLNSV